MFDIFHIFHLRTDVTDNTTPVTITKDKAPDNLKPYPQGIRAAAVIAAWLVPGAGHLILGRYKKALLLFVVITGSFVFGLALHGRIFWPAEAVPASKLYYDLISVLWTFAQFGSGLYYLGSLFLGIGTTIQAESSTYEYGNTFMFLAGLLNYLVVLDVFDIGAGRKH